jgi:hypothetical protein
VIISQAAEPDSSVLQEPLLGPSPLPNGGGVETPVPARSEDRKEPAVAKPAPEKVGENASTAAAAMAATAEDCTKAGENASTAAAMETEAEDCDGVEVHIKKRGKEEVDDLRPEEPLAKKRACPNEEHEESLRQQDLQQVAEFEKGEAEAAAKELKRSRGSESSAEILGSCGVCSAGLTKRIGIFFCLECGGDVCAAPSCSWDWLGLCKKCTPRLLEKAVASAPDSSFWSDTPLMNNAKAQVAFKQDLQEAIYLKHNPFTGTHMHPHTSTLQHTYIYCTPRISYAPHTSRRALHQRHRGRTGGALLRQLLAFRKLRKDRRIGTEGGHTGGREARDSVGRW